jgi:hypothetical protein
MQRQQVRATYDSRQSVFRIHVDCSHQVKPQERKVCEVVLCEILATKVGVDTAQASEPSLSYTHAFEVGKFDPSIVTHHYVLDVTFAINQSAYLAARLVREFA